MTTEETLLRVLRKMTVCELMDELINIEKDYQRKLLTTISYNMSVELAEKVLEEKRQENRTMEAYKRSMVGI